MLDTLTLASRAADVLTDPDRRKEAEEYARVLGVDLPTAVRAMVGDTNALAVVNKIAASAQSELTAAEKQHNETQNQGLLALDQDYSAKQRQIDKAKELTAVVDQANKTFQDQQAVLKGLISDAGTATEEVDALGNKLYTLPDGSKIVIEADTGNATTNLDKFKGDVDGIPETVTTKLVVDTSGAESEISRFIAKPRKVGIEALFETKSGRPIP